MCNNRFQRVQHYISGLNFFESGSPDELIIKQERFTTRFYLTAMFILLLLSGSVVLAMKRSINAYVSASVSFRITNSLLTTLLMNTNF